jgi:hypothetical protein
MVAAPRIRNLSIIMLSLQRISQDSLSRLLPQYASTGHRAYRVNRGFKQQFHGGTDSPDRVKAERH